MHLSAQAKRLTFLLAFVAASMFATMLYYLFFNFLIVESIGLPRALGASKELAAANRPDLYLQLCRAFVETVLDGEKLRLEVFALLRVAVAFMIVGSGLLFLLGMRLLRLGSLAGGADVTPGRFSPARIADYLIALWEGKCSLRNAFWAFSLPLAAAAWAALILLFVQLNAKELVALLYMSMGCGIAMVSYLFSLSVVWRCANNTQNKIWGWLARTVVVLLVAILALRLLVVARAIAPFLQTWLFSGSL